MNKWERLKNYPSVDYCYDKDLLNLAFNHENKEAIEKLIEEFELTYGEDIWKEEW